ncbi:non-specific lipid transfer protein GPI-anchored 5-like [Phragmites australis]|uniref:non-specific lipid transfer protein GPI-anchored 5-like n=1 Tax=Phragmites australis TaxID=29695 RepID=UPI002D7A2C07|nr:non-specific lipid transfer protein GPI-anchored 5-like [Phragmites australis]
MAARGVASLAVAVMVVVVLLAGGATAQSPSSPSNQCTSVLVSLSPCLNYISGNESTAPASCCTQLAKVVQSDPQCLCVALNADPASLGLNVNRTRALGLPDACKVKTPDVSNCKGAAASPTSPSSSGTPAGQTPASGATGSKTTPTTSETGAAASPRGSAGLVAGFIVAAVLAVFAV